MIKLIINHKERKTNVLCFPQTSIKSSNLADFSHGTGALAAVQTAERAHQPGSYERYQRSSTCPKKRFPTFQHCWVFPEPPHQVCGIVGVKPSLGTADRRATSRSCKFGANRTNSKRNYANDHGFRHVKPTELCLTRRSRTNELSLQRSQKLNISNRFSFLIH